MNSTLKATIAVATTCALAGASSPARACGGLFCSNTNPVNQAAERIIFAQNDDGTVTAAIEIQYEGPSDEFAWVLPVPAGTIEVGVSSKISFDRLQAQSNPQYNLQRRFEDCGDDESDGGGVTTGATNDADFSDLAEPDANAGEAVTVIQEGRAGPYEYTQIEVNEDLDDPADVAIEWLEENDYDVGEIGPDVLRPYLADGQNLVAFRLSKDNDAGSIRPLLITYQSDNPMIPIIPTAVAANPDMGILVWVLGSGRAVPANFYHLELNEAMINWFNPSPTYNDVIIAAADEAGGQGFVTEQSGAAGQFSEAIFADWEQEEWDYLQTGTFGTLLDFLETAVFSFGNYDGFVDLLNDEEVFPLRDGATVEQFIDCMPCYFETNVAVRNNAYPSTEYDPETDPLNNMDVVAFLEKMDELVITPLQATRAMFDEHESVTRLYTTLSPDEMTVDPVFDFNPELPGYDNLHSAEQVFLCDAETEWRIDLPQGMTITGNDQTWPVELGSDFPVNFRVVQLETEGEGDVVIDNRETIADLLTSEGVGEPGPDMMGSNPNPLGLDDPTAEDDPSNTDEDPDGDPGANDTNSDADDDTIDDDMGSTAQSGGCSLTASADGPSIPAWLALLGLPVLLRRRRRAS